MKNTDDSHFLGGILSRLKMLIPASWKQSFWGVMPDRIVSMRSYYHRFGVYPDLNNPKALSEKIQWLKLYGMTPLHSKCADKIRVRDFVADRVGSDILVKKILSTYDVSQIKPELIPDKMFVVKTNHDSGTVIFCHDRDNFDWEACRKRLQIALDRNFFMLQREHQYKGIKPGVIVEEFLEGQSGESPADYKFQCFHGRVVCVQVDIDRYTDHARAIFDRDWKPTGDRLEYLPGIPKPFLGSIEKPKGFNKMVQIAESLAEGFVLCRVDLYNINGRIFFGELTFTPHAGLARFEPIDADLRYGQLLELGASKGNR